MNNILDFRAETPMDNKLIAAWVDSPYYQNSTGNWRDFISVQPGVIDVRFYYPNTIIKFKDEKYKIWFLLRWS